MKSIKFSEFETQVWEFLTRSNNINRTQFNKLLDIHYSFVYCCYVYTLYNLFALSSCTSLLILLFIKYFSTYIYVFSLVLCDIFCTVHWADLIHISLLNIICIIEYVTNKILNPWKWSLSIFLVHLGSFTKN